MNKSESEIISAETALERLAYASRILSALTLWDMRPGAFIRVCKQAQQQLSEQPIAQQRSLVRHWLLADLRLRQHFDAQTSHEPYE
jgi:hypothetical protein